MRSRFKLSKRIILILCFAGFVVAVHFFVLFLVGHITNVSVDFGSELDEINSRDYSTAYANDLNAKEAASFSDLDEVSPFIEIDPLDDDAKDWSSFFDGYANTGILVSDLNNDGLQDLYLCRNGNTWLRPTNENAVLAESPKQQFNTLYINQGNDSSGYPEYAQLKNLASQNQTFVEEELLVENYLFPRTTTSDTSRRVGRASSTAIAADINGDGLPDLLVGNTLPGMLWSHPKTQRVLDHFVRPVGRQAIKTKLPLAAQGLYFLKDYQVNDDSNDSRSSARGIEAMGANSIFLNMGDKDGDQLPEWKDISRECGLEGSRNTMALLAADFDLDGDIDIFEANIMDMDFWPGGATHLAGAANMLYINQLKEKGTLTFEERSAEMKVDGLYNEGNPVPNYYKLKKYPLLPEAYSVGLRSVVPYQPGFLEINGEKSEPGQISWAAVAQDVNSDGYPDIWVANDLGFLRLYINEEGKSFRQENNHARSKQTGYWMSFAPADFNNDLQEDLFAGNIGGASMNLAMPLPDLFTLFDPVISSGTMAQQFFKGHQNSMHALLDGASGFSQEFETKVRHSSIMPPDASAPNNTRDFVIVGSAKVDFDPNSLDPYEFTWGSTTLDVQNDGRQDLYWVGCLYGRGGGAFPIMGSGPGRLLVNATPSGEQVRMVDQTAEHHLFNIKELRYDSLKDHGYVYRPSPLQNWGKRSMVYSYDISVWGFQGVGLMERISNHDLIQCSENGRAAISSDLNNDGFADIIVRNIGGYDSRSSRSKNLKGIVNGREVVIPAHDANFPSPTNFEPGDTRVFINSYRKNKWLKVKLIDDHPESLNRDAIGARVIVNNKNMQVLRSGGGSFASNQFGPLLFGLGDVPASHIIIEWPDRARSRTEYPLPQYQNGLLIVSRTEGIISWQPAPSS